MGGLYTNMMYYIRKPLIVVAMVENGRPVSALAKDVETSLSHLSRMLARLQEDGIIVTKKEGRTKRVYLTEKGKKVKELVTALLLEIDPRNNGRTG